MSITVYSLYAVRVGQANTPSKGKTQKDLQETRSQKAELLEDIKRCMGCFNFFQFNETFFFNN